MCHLSTIVVMILIGNTCFTFRGTVTKFGAASPHFGWMAAVPLDRRGLRSGHAGVSFPKRWRPPAAA